MLARVRAHLEGWHCRLGCHDRWGGVETPRTGEWGRCSSALLALRAASARAASRVWTGSARRGDVHECAQVCVLCTARCCDARLFVAHCRDGLCSSRSHSCFTLTIEQVRSHHIHCRRRCGSVLYIYIGSLFVFTSRDVLEMGRNNSILVAGDATEGKVEPGGW